MKIGRPRFIWRRLAAARVRHVCLFVVHLAPVRIQPGEPYDKTYAHKPWVLKYNGAVYHFYCAVGDQGRAIALATSKDLRNQK